MKFRFLIENKTDNPGVVAEHGLSIYIETQGKKILFDAGATEMILLNAKTMGIDLGTIDFGVVSHGHYDHTGGFPLFHQINPGAPIYIHRNALRVSYGMEDGKIDKEPCSIAWNDEELKELSPALRFTDGRTDITENIVVTGTVPIPEGYVPTEQFWRVAEGCDAAEDVVESNGVKLVPDDMSHEQCLVIREPEGLYIFSGCSHRGVINALNAGKSMFPGERVAVLVAGMHLYSASDEDRARVVDEIAAENMDCVMPVHCTGIKAICDLKTRLGDNCIVATAGDEYLI
ncbi:MAG: MBL fold metallo-hydrolase [Clostridia bacterium]|nr:MBL fold metallo-hydrolase [Clostridia bacterium]